MKIVSGTFNGTGAALTIGLGFVPDFVKVFNLESANLEKILFSINSRSLEQIEGIMESFDGTDMISAPLGVGAGIVPYRGGVQLAAASTAILVRDPVTDKRAANTAALPITTWTLGNAGNRTGNFDAQANTTFVGEGSRITVEGLNGDIRTATVLAIANNGAAANEVTLSEALPSGTILALSGMFDYLGANAGIITPKGFTINEAGNLNVAGEMCRFEAGQYN